MTAHKRKSSPTAATPTVRSSINKRTTATMSATTSAAECHRRRCQHNSALLQIHVTVSATWEDDSWTDRRLCDDDNVVVAGVADEMYRRKRWMVQVERVSRSSSSSSVETDKTLTLARRLTLHWHCPMSKNASWFQGNATLSLLVPLAIETDGARTYFTGGSTTRFLVALWEMEQHHHSARLVTQRYSTFAALHYEQQQQQNVRLSVGENRNATNHTLSYHTAMVRVTLDGHTKLVVVPPVLQNTNNNNNNNNNNTSSTAITQQHHTTTNVLMARMDTTTAAAATTYLWWTMALISWLWYVRNKWKESAAKWNDTTNTTHHATEEEDTTHQDVPTLTTTQSSNRSNNNDNNNSNGLLDKRTRRPQPRQYGSASGRNDEMEDHDHSSEGSDVSGKVASRSGDHNHDDDHTEDDGLREPLEDVSRMEHHSEERSYVLENPPKLVRRILDPCWLEHPNDMTNYYGDYYDNDDDDVAQLPYPTLHPFANGATVLATAIQESSQTLEMQINHLDMQARTEVAALLTNELPRKHTCPMDTDHPASMEDNEGVDENVEAVTERATTPPKDPLTLQLSSSPCSPDHEMDDKTNMDEESLGESASHASRVTLLGEDYEWSARQSSQQQACCQLDTGSPQCNLQDEVLDLASLSKCNASPWKDLATTPGKAPLDVAQTTTDFGEAMCAGNTIRVDERRELLGRQSEAAVDEHDSPAADRSWQLAATHDLDVRLPITSLQGRSDLDPVSKSIAMPFKNLDLTNHHDEAPLEDSKSLFSVADFRDELTTQAEDRGFLEKHAAADEGETDPPSAGSLPLAACEKDQAPCQPAISSQVGSDRDPVNKASPFQEWNLLAHDDAPGDDSDVRSSRFDLYDKVGDTKNGGVSERELEEQDEAAEDEMDSPSADSLPLAASEDQAPCQPATSSQSGPDIEPAAENNAFPFHEWDLTARDEAPVDLLHSHFSRDNFDDGVGAKTTGGVSERQLEEHDEETEDEMDSHSADSPPLAASEKDQAPCQPAISSQICSDHEPTAANNASPFHEWDLTARDEASGDDSDVRSSIFDFHDGVGVKKTGGVAERESEQDEGAEDDMDSPQTESLPLTASEDQALCQPAISSQSGPDREPVAANEGSPFQEWDLLAEDEAPGDDLNVHSSRSDLFGAKKTGGVAERELLEEAEDERKFQTIDCFPLGGAVCQSPRLPKTGPPSGSPEMNQESGNSQSANHAYLRPSSDDCKENRPEKSKMQLNRLPESPCSSYVSTLPPDSDCSSRELVDAGQPERLGTYRPLITDIEFERDAVSKGNVEATTCAPRHQAKQQASVLHPSPLPAPPRRSRSERKEVPTVAGLESTRPSSSAKDERESEARTPRPSCLPDVVPSISLSSTVERFSMPTWEIDTDCAVIDLTSDSKVAMRSRDALYPLASNRTGTNPKAAKAGRNARKRTKSSDGARIRASSRPKRKRLTY